jgi:hypothetical protein
LVLTVVIDTNIYISAIFWNGKPREVIDLGRDGKIIIFTLLLHKDTVELPECFYKEPVYSLLMIPFKSHL